MCSLLIIHHFSVNSMTLTSPVLLASQQFPQLIAAGWHCDSPFKVVCSVYHILPPVSRSSDKKTSCKPCHLYGIIRAAPEYWSVLFPETTLIFWTQKPEPGLCQTVIRKNEPTRADSFPASFKMRCLYTHRYFFRTSALSSRSQERFRSSRPKCP